MPSEQPPIQRRYAKPGRPKTKKKVVKRKTKSVWRNTANPHLRPCSDRDNYVLNLYFENGFNKRQALRDSGFYSPASCLNADQFFNRPHIVREISRRMAVMKDEVDINEKNVLQQLARIAFADAGDLIVPDDGGGFTIDFGLITANMRSAISEFVVEETMAGRGDDAVPVTKVRFKTHSKLQALEMLSKHLGLFQDAATISIESDVIDALAAGRQRVLRGRRDVVDAEYEVMGEQKAIAWQPPEDVDDEPVVRKARRS